MDQKRDDDFDTDMGALPEINFAEITLEHQVVKSDDPNLNAESAFMSRVLLKRQLLDILDEKVALDVPTSLIDQEAKKVALQIWLEDNPEAEDQDIPEIEVTPEHTMIAERRVRLGVYLNELGEKAEVKVSGADMKQAIMEEATYYPGQETEFLEFAQQDIQTQEQIRYQLFENKIIDYIFEQTQINEKEVSIEQLQAAFEAM